MDDHNNDDDIAHDDWLDSGTLTDDISLTQHLADVNIFSSLCSPFDAHGCYIGTAITHPVPH